MIETEQAVTIRAGIHAVWDYASDFPRWAALMPGYRECIQIDGDTSEWTLKVGVGALVRTVKVVVTVESWGGPERVDFRYRLEGDPVEGQGTYTATAAGDEATNVVLTVQVTGSGPLAPMWEAMGKPLLPKLARSFAEQLRDAIEAANGVAPAEDAPKPKLMSTLKSRLSRA